MEEIIDPVSFFGYELSRLDEFFPNWKVLAKGIMQPSWRNRSGILQRLVISALHVVEKAMVIPGSILE
jgi:hypothetical protein